MQLYAVTVMYTVVYDFLTMIIVNIDLYYAMDIIFM